MISIAVLIAVLLQLRQLDWLQVWSAVPISPLFWLIFAISYLSAPFADWLIFRRLWKIPFSGIIPLVGKLIGNEVLLGYIGEVYFYNWARTRIRLTGSPFGAVKDVAILSALAGNAVTLMMIVAIWPLLVEFRIGYDSRMLLLSVGFVMLTSLAVMFFRRKLLGLPGYELRFITAVHVARIFATTGLAALIWHLVLPEVALSWWLLLATMRMLLSRLPFIPNKDLVFAGLATFLVGRDIEIANMMAMTASLTLATHIILGAAFMAVDLLSGTQKS